MLTTSEKLDLYEAIIFDILDGQSRWHDIQSITGLSEERCKEIELNYLHICRDYEERHGMI